MGKDSDDMQHIANLWADLAVNGLQWLKNVRDGISTFHEAILDMERHIKKVRNMGKTTISWRDQISE